MPDAGSGPATRAVAVAPSVLRGMNQRLLLDHLFAHGAATRPELARATGLSLPTVGAALADLESAQLTRTVSERPGHAHGRPAVRYEADPTAGHVVGVDVGRSWLHVSLADLAGAELGRIDVRNTARSADALVRKIGDAVEHVAGATGLLTSDVTHTVIGSPGVFDAKRGRVLYAANLPGWQRVGLSDALTERLGTSLTIDNDANLAAIGEHTYGSGRGTDHFVYVHIGTGVGIGLVLGGTLYQGFNGAAGEVGYLPLGERMSTGRPGRAQRGMLEENLSADAVVRYAHEHGLERITDAHAVFEAAAGGDVNAQTVVTAVAKNLAQLIASIGAFLDPELISVGGGVGQNLPVMERDMRSALALLTPIVPNLSVSTLGADAVLKGAIATGVRHARDRAFSKRLAGS